MLVGGDADGAMTAVAVGIAKLGEAAVLATHKEASGFVGTGRALSAAAGRLSYVHGLKVCCCHLQLGGMYQRFHGVSISLYAAGRLYDLAGQLFNIERSTGYAACIVILV